MLRALTRNNIVALGAGVLLGISVYVHVLTGNAGDKNWLLLATRMWLEGKKLYVDLFEVDPPFIFLVYAFPVYVSMHIAFLTDAYALALFGLATVALCIQVSGSLIKCHPQFANDTRKQLQFMLLLVFAFIFYANSNYFFDRDYILLVLTFPYMLRFMPSLSGVVLPVCLKMAIGLLATVGFCAKPHAVILFAAIQLAFVLRERSFAILRSPENSIIYGGGLLYLFYVLHFTPEYVAVVVPMAFATYSAYKANGVIFLILALIMFGVTLVDFRPRQASPYRKDLYYLLWVSFSWLAYALTNNGWGYTWYPLMAMGQVFACWMLWEHCYLRARHAALGLPLKRFDFGVRACAISLLCNFALALSGLVAFFSISLCDTNLECRKYSLLLHEVTERHIRSFGVMSGEYHKWAQISRVSGARWDTRFNNLWMLPKFAESGDDFVRKHQWILDYIDRAYTEDLNRRKPAAVFVELGGPLKFPSFFGHTPEFTEAWGHYHFEGVINLCKATSMGVAMMPDCSYAIYERAK